MPRYISATGRVCGPDIVYSEEDIKAIEEMLKVKDLKVKDLKVKEGEVYRHFKGGLYIVKSVDKDSEEDGIYRVSYKDVKGDGYSRPYGMFIELVTIASSHVSETRVPRFQKTNMSEWWKEEAKELEGADKEAKVIAILEGIKRDFVTYIDRVTLNVKELV